MAEHNLDIEAYIEKQTAKKELQKPHTPPNSIIDLRKRVALLEKAIGINVTDTE